jgi:cation transport ATPase
MSTFIPLGALRREGEAAPPSETVRLRISGMHCAACVGRVERAMAGVPGVHAARVNLATQRAEADVAAGAAGASLPALLEAVRGAGYEAHAVTSPVVDDREAAERAAEEALVRRRFALAAGCGAGVFVLAHAGMVWPGILPGTPLQQGVAQALLALPVQFVAGAPFLRGLVRGIVRRQPDMDTLVGLGTLTAFAYSLWVLLTAAPGAHAGHGMLDLYFDTSVTIVALVLLGRVLEARARTGTSRALRALLELRPRTAQRLQDGRESEVPLDDVLPGDVLVVRPGERVPVDGRVLEGRSAVDRALVTGERSAPATR